MMGLGVRLLAPLEGGYLEGGAGGESPPLPYDFAQQSLVGYTLIFRVCPQQIHRWGLLSTI